MNSGPVIYRNRSVRSGGAGPVPDYAGPVTTSVPEAASTAAKPVPVLLRDPALVETTFVVLDFEGTTSAAYAPEPIEVAAVALRRDGDRWLRVWSFEALMKPQAHAPVTGFDCSIGPRGRTTTTPARRQWVIKRSSLRCLGHSPRT